MRAARPVHLHLALLAFWLPLALAAAASAQEPAPASAPAAALAKPSEPAKPVDPAAEVPRGITGVILNITSDVLSIRNLAQGAGGGRGFLTLAGDANVPVTGLRKSYGELQKGDLVAVSYQGDPPRATGIQVLPRKLDPQFAAAAGMAPGQDPYAKGGRGFVGWIKQIDDKTMVLRTPNGPAGSKRKGDVKTFVRTDHTTVELYKHSWEELKKGDRVEVTFEKGEPRPVDRIRVVLIGGQKPLPPGLATLLFDPAYDKTVKDVDGIGEWPPDKEWPSGKPKASAEGARSEAKSSEAQKIDPAGSSPRSAGASPAPQPAK
ncbi:MAG TPA: hypothetical protein VMS55_11715 [Myxococcota bacterium]|nr:hypothetical protein [Myxococcota bacterium]